jgi:putative mRNA 3-end processing factor
MSFIIERNLYVPSIDAWIDPGQPRARAIITHGHADHARSGHGAVLATPETIAIMKTRYGEDCAGRFEPLPFGERLRIGSANVSLHPAGHILGSAQVLIEAEGQRVLVTGDYKRRPDRTAEPFEPVRCDLLITEATFGLPVFQHPAPEAEIARLLKSVATHPERCHLVGCYALGKAQRVIGLLRDAGWDQPIYLHGAMVRLCALYEELGVPLGDLRPATGWMSIKQRARQALVELPLVISDHCDWDELNQSILESGAGTVWVTHGREDALVYWCRLQGLAAEPLALPGLDDDGGEGGE